MSSNEVTWKDKLKAYTRTPGSLIVMLLVMLSAIMTFAVLIFLIVYVLAPKKDSKNGEYQPSSADTIGLLTWNIYVNRLLRSICVLLERLLGCLRLNLRLSCLQDCITMRAGGSFVRNLLSTMGTKNECHNTKYISVNK